MTKTVMATRPGTYGHYREEGAVFEIAKAEDFSKVWMVEVTTAEAKKLQALAAADGLAAKHVVDTSVVDNAELEALKAQIAEKDAEIERLKRPKTVKAKSEGGSTDNSAGGTNDQPKTAAEVLAMGNDPTVPFMTFKAAAVRVLGDETPSTKAEIVAALEDKATQP